MYANRYDLVKVLETELRFLDNGGYRNPDMWRPQFVFLDSPTCVHPAGSGRPEACSDCPLIGFVPKARRDAPVPCHHIPLTREKPTGFAAKEAASAVWAGSCPVPKEVNASTVKPKMEIRIVVRQVCISFTTRPSSQCSAISIR